MKNKFTFLILLSCIVFSNSLFSQWQGAGTRTNPYKIFTFQDMKTLSDRVNSGNTYERTYFKLMNDIDFNQDTTFIPIGGQKRDYSQGPARWRWEYAFNGTFDGNYKVIRNLRIIRPNIFSQTDTVAIFISKQLGLFGLIGYKGVVKNLGLERAYIQGDAYIGVLAAVNMGSIESCYANGIIIAGRLYDDNLHITGAKAAFIGGLIGLEENLGLNAIVQNCYADVLLEYGGIALGGLTALCLNSFKNCYSKGLMSPVLNFQQSCFCFSANATGNIYKYNYHLIDCCLCEDTIFRHGVSTPKSAEEFRSAMIIDSLNMEQPFPNFVKGIDTTMNDGYPLLWWQVRDYVHTRLPSDINFTSATFNGSYSKQIPNVTDCGFFCRVEGDDVWYQYPATFDSIGDTLFSANIGGAFGLDARVEFMAYVIGNGGSMYRSEESSFSLLNSQGNAFTMLPVVDTHSAILKGYYANGYLPTIEKGFEWKEKTEPEYTSVYVLEDVDTMMYLLSNLTSNTIYSYRAFIVNNATQYGEWEDFTTLYDIGLNDIEKTNHITLYPNPTKNEISITTKGELINDYLLYGIDGKEILRSEMIKLNNAILNLYLLPKGVYVLKVRTDRNVYTKKVIRN
jgi:hypothetical protein